MASPADESISLLRPAEGTGIRSRPLPLTLSCCTTPPSPVLDPRGATPLTIWLPARLPWAVRSSLPSAGWHTATDPARPSGIFRSALPHLGRGKFARFHGWLAHRSPAG